MYTKFEPLQVGQVRLSYELHSLMQSLSQNFAALGDSYLFLVGSLIHDLIYKLEPPKANDIDLVLFIPQHQKSFLPILSSFFPCPHVPGLYQLKVMGRYKVDLMVVEVDFSDPDFLLKHVIEKHDFSISSLFCDSSGKIFDPSGLGYKDLLAKNLDLVSDVSVSQVINHLTCLRALKYVERGFVISPNLHRVLSMISYKTVFEDPHFCNLLRRLIFNQIGMVETIAKYGFLEKFLDKSIDITTMNMREMHERLVMKTLNLTTIAELKDELRQLERENAELETAISDMNVTNKRLETEIFDTRLETEPMKMRLAELEAQLSIIKQEILDLEIPLEEKRQIILGQTQVLNRLIGQRYSLINEGLGLKACLQTHALKSQALFKQQLKQDKALSQKLNQKLGVLKKKNHELDVALSLANVQVQNLRKEAKLFSTETESLEKNLEEQRKFVEAGQAAYHEKLELSHKHPPHSNTRPSRNYQPFICFDPHPWDEIETTQLEFIFKFWQEDSLRVPLGLRLARDYLFKRQDHKAILLLIFCQYLLDAPSNDLAVKIDYLSSKIKLKYSRVYWQVKTEKEWYDIGQKLYSLGRYVEAIAFYFSALQVESNYIHPVIQIINAAIHLKDWNFLEWGLDSLATFKHPEPTMGSGEAKVLKYQGHALKVLTGVYQKLISEYYRLAAWMELGERVESDLTQIWEWVAVHRLLHLDVFRENLTGEEKALLPIETIYEKILAFSEPRSFSRLMAHINLAAISKDGFQVNLHFKAAVDMDLLPKLETMYASSPKMSFSSSLE